MSTAHTPDLPVAEEVRRFFQMCLASALCQGLGGSCPTWPQLLWFTQGACAARAAGYTKWHASMSYAVM